MDGSQNYRNLSQRGQGLLWNFSRIAALRVKLQLNSCLTLFGYILSTPSIIIRHTIFTSHFHLDIAAHEDKDPQTC